MFDILWHGYEWFWMALISPGPWHCWILSKTPCNKTHQNHTKPTDEKHENFARIWPSHHYYSLFLSVFSPSLYKTTSILVLDHPWFSSLVIYGGMFDILWHGFEWFWYPLAPGTAEILSVAPLYDKPNQDHTKPTVSVWQGTRWDTVALLSHRFPCSWSVT